MIPDETIADIRQRTDLVALIGQHVALKKVGTSFRGLCPFHQEKTPSFYVHPHRRFYHCFGCGASGDAFKFLMELEQMSFPQVARELAERCGVELPEEDAPAQRERNRHRARMDRWVGIMEAATEFYMEQLHAHPSARVAREALSARSIGADATKKFRLGYAPDGWEALSQHLKRRGCSLDEAEMLGLVGKRRGGGGHYDRFRHRLMFPVTDSSGHTVAFSGRALDPLDGDAAATAKYINSPEGPLFKKGDVLFGLHQARVVARRRGELLVCEGNFDLVALSQAGFEHVVAPLGTALTEAHAKLLRRYAERVVLLFDGDKAGRRAVRRASPLLLAEGLSANVVPLPAGDDPDSFLRANGAESLQNRVDAALGITEYLIDDAAAEAAGDPRARAEAIEKLGPLLASVANPVEVRLYVERVARRFEIGDLDAVRRQLRRGVVLERRGAAGRRAGPDQTVRPQRGDAPQRHNSRPRHNSSPKTRPADSAQVPHMQRELVAAILDQPELVRSEQAADLGELLTSPDLRAIFQAVLRMVEQQGEVDASALIDGLQHNRALAWLRGRLAVQQHDLPEAEQVLRDGVPRLAQQNIAQELPKMQRRILEARRGGEESVALELTREYMALSRSAHRLKQGTTR